MPEDQRDVFIAHEIEGYSFKEIAARTGVGAKDTLVCGDIYELDLALPQSLGCAVHLMTRAATPTHEREFVGPGQHGDDLRAILARLG